MESASKIGCDVIVAVQGGRLRNWKTASGRTTPQRTYGRGNGRKCSARRKGAGRAIAVLE